MKFVVASLIATVSATDGTAKELGACSWADGTKADKLCAKDLCCAYSTSMDMSKETREEYKGKPEVIKGA